MPMQNLNWTLRNLSSFYVRSYRPRGGRHHLIFGRNRPFCNKVQVAVESRFPFIDAVEIDCNYCRNFAIGRARTLLAEHFPSWPECIDNLHYLHDFLSDRGDLRDARIVRCACLFKFESGFSW